jgi:hypothetical protein
VAAPGILNAGLIITPVFDSTITSDPNKAAIESTINTAISFYESTFSNPIDVSITYSEMSSGLGESEFSLYTVNYSDYYTALKNNETSANNVTAVAHLTNTSGNPVNGGTQMYIKPALASALGLDGVGSNVSGGTILLNTSLTTPGSVGTSGSYSLLAVVEHETDEILGLGSTLGLSGNGINTSQISPEDLFRYTSTGTRSFTTSGSATAYFSINGTTDIAQFNQDSSGDYGDWASEPSTPKVQDAFGTPGSSPYLTASSPEVEALNVIGYGLDSAATPEPATAALLGSALIAGVFLKRRLRK